MELLIGSSFTLCYEKSYWPHKVYNYNFVLTEDDDMDLNFIRFPLRFDGCKCKWKYDMRRLPRKTQEYIILISQCTTTEVSFDYVNKTVAYIHN